VFALTPRTPRATNGLGIPMSETEPAQQHPSEGKKEDLEKD
jgi:hypothetical protein